MFVCGDVSGSGHILQRVPATIKCAHAVYATFMYVHCELFKRRKLSERVKKSRKIGTQLGIEPRTF